jgi:protein-disulfide isomerase-like protein with CxxC motif
VAEVATLEAIAREQGLALEPFRAGCAALSDQDMRAHIQQSRMLLQQHGGAGFPCFVLEHNGRQQRLDHERHYGNPAAWRRYLESALA